MASGSLTTAWSDPSGSTLLYLVRHAAQNHSGAADAPDGGLSPLGEQQAHLLTEAVST